MAFRELSEDEIALLNEMERAQYEKQLKIYRETTALVEKFEIRERTIITQKGLPPAREADLLFIWSLS